MTIQHLVSHFGYAAIFLLVLGESAGLPVPGETALLLGSVLTVTGAPLRLPVIAVVGIAAAFLGDNIGYWFGRRHGTMLVGWIARRPAFSRWSVQKAGLFFHRYGVATLIAGRFIAFIRVVMPVAAGASGMNAVQFVAGDFIGVVLWVGTICLAGQTLGVHRMAAEAMFDRAGLVVLGILIIAAAYVALRKRLRR